MRFLKRALHPLRVLSEFMSKIITVIVLTIVYIFGIGPLSLLGLIFRKDFIGQKRRETNSYWLKSSQPEPTLEKMKKLY